MKIPHDPVALEEHFRDDDEGPLSNQGYMPYLNRFILDKVGPNYTQTTALGLILNEQFNTCLLFFKDKDQR